MSAFMDSIAAKPEKAHAKLSASGSHRWMNCPGSIQLSQNAPVSGSSEYASEGTEAHECHEFLLKNRAKFTAAQVQARKRWPDDMVDHAIDSVQFIVNKAADAGKDAEILCETKVDLSFVAPEMFGTVDAAIVDVFGTLWVIDYKYGAGVPVEVKDNSQLIYYALGIAHKYGYNFEEVILVVVQPRAEHIDGPIRWHQMSIDELMSWEFKFRDAAALTEDPLANLEPGDWCRWCPAKAICPSISDLALKQAQVDFAPEQSPEVVLPVPNMIRPELLSNILQGIEKLETWIEGVKEHAFAVMSRGAKVPGFKLVQKRSIRKWIDPEKTAAKADMVYGDDAFERKLLSPAQFEKHVKTDGAGKFIAKHSSNESSGLTLVNESDKRPAVSLEGFTVWEGTTDPKTISLEGKGESVSKKVKVVKKSRKATTTKKRKK